MEVVDIKKILVPNLLIYIYLHCVKSSSWCATMLATLVYVNRKAFFVSFLYWVDFKTLTVWGWGTVHLPRPFEDVLPLLENWLKWHWFQLLCHLHGFLPFQLYFQDLPIMRNEKTILGIFSIKKENFQFYFQHWPSMMRNENNNLIPFQHTKVFLS